MKFFEFSLLERTEEEDRKLYPKVWAEKDAKAAEEEAAREAEAEGSEMTVAQKAKAYRDATHAIPDKQSQQIMPDLVISEIPQNVKASLNHKIAIELKSTSPGKTHTPSFDTSNYEKDFRKLNALKDYGLLTYYIFIDSDSNVTENTTKEAIKNKEFRVSQRKKQVKKKFNTIVINRFFNPRKKSKQTDDEIKEIRERQMRMFRTYPDDDDPRFSTESKKPKSKSSRKNPNRIAAAKKAWKNSPKLRAKRRK